MGKNLFTLPWSHRQFWYSKGTRSPMTIFDSNFDSFIQPSFNLPGLISTGLWVLFGQPYAFRTCAALLDSETCWWRMWGPLVDIINLFLDLRVYPEGLKEVLVILPLKKRTLNLSYLSYCHPVSHLFLGGKVIENVVAEQLHSFLDDTSVPTHSSRDSILATVDHDLLTHCLPT